MTGAVNIFYSTDTGAPTINGVAGSLYTTLQKCLVTGYGSKSGAGWTNPYTGTNQGVFTMASGGTGFSFYINDNTPSIANEATVIAWQSPTGLDTGTGQWPLSSQLTAIYSNTLGTPWRKSESANSTANWWVVAADNNTVYVIISTGLVLNGTLLCQGFVFGDLGGVASTDSWACCLQGNRVFNNTSCGNWNFSNVGLGLTDVEGSGQWMAMGPLGIGSSPQYGKYIDSTLQGGVTTQQNGNGSGGNGMGHLNNAATFPYPNLADGSLVLSQIRIGSNVCVRGHYKGLWAPLQNLPLNHLDTMTVTSGNLSGKSFLAISVPVTDLSWGSRVAPGMILLETSNTWS